MKALQEKLRTLHLMTSPASAHFDAATQEAVLTFQKRHPWLKVDAVVGPKTIAEINESISQLEGELLLERFAAEGAAMGMADLQANPRLGLALQRRLHGLGLYPGGPLLDGDFGSRSQSSLEKFCTFRGIDSSTPLQLTSAIVADVLKSPSLDQVFAQADQVETLAHVYHEMEIQAEATFDHLALLDMGANGSPFRESLYRCNEAIQQATASGVASSHPQPLDFEDYPSLGSLPTIKSVPAAFFGPDIAEACICVGEIKEGQLLSSWLGHRPLELVECWSASKIIPILNVFSQLGGLIPENTDELLLRNMGNVVSQFQLKSACIDICSYRDGVPKSNALAATLNAFERNREKWIRSQTGNQASIVFGGRYGFPPEISLPEIYDETSEKVLLHSQAESRGGNAISTYDLTRLMSLLGWHKLLSPTQRLSTLADKAYADLLTIFSTDTARYVDVALTTLGVVPRIDQLAVFSKLGYGYSKERDVTEAVYTAFIQFIDQPQGSSARLRSLALTLRSSLPGNGDRTGIRADTAIGVAVTRLLRRVLLDDFT